MSKTSLFALTRTQLQELLQPNIGFAKASLHAKSIFKNLYKLETIKDDFSFPLVGNKINHWLTENFSFDYSVKIKEFFLSEVDQSVKFIIELLQDNLLVESVLIPEKNRLTLCVSTQVGCAQGCRFCHTGRMGLRRSLTTDEIVGQLKSIQKWMFENNYDRGSVTNVVYMGMGEPLDNLEAVVESADIFTDPMAFFLSPHRVTVSTVGILPQLEQIFKRTLVSVAWSLHSPFSVERSQVMPVNIRHPLNEVLQVFKGALDRRERKSILVQYTLLKGVNDSLEHAAALSQLLKGYLFKVNIIPLNEHSGTIYRKPNLDHVLAFQDVLKKAGLLTTIRFSKGQDIAAACGQLIQKRKKNNDVIL